MTYEVRFAGPAKRDLSKLPEAVAAAVMEFAERPLRENPRRVGKELFGPLAGLYAARRGEYRILYRIDDVLVLVTVVALRHRRDAYRR